MNDNSFARDCGRDWKGGITGGNGSVTGGSGGVDFGLVDVEPGHECGGVCFAVATLNLVTMTNTRCLAIRRTFREFTPCSPVS